VLSLRSPLYVTGTLSHPAVSPDTATLAARGAAAAGMAVLNPFAALIPLVETGPGKDSPCGQLVAWAEEHRREGKETTGEAKRGGGAGRQATGAPAPRSAAKGGSGDPG
jgi:hypothetical protein